MPASLHQLNVSDGGMPKRAIDRARITTAGVAGDRQRNRKVHGGPKRAVCIYSVELYGWLNEQGVAVRPGDLGENLTTEGIDLQSLNPGDRLRIGGTDGCLIEITKVREPCSQLKKWDADLPELILGRSGWVAKVVEEGEVEAGDLIERLPSSEVRSDR